MYMYALFKWPRHKLLLLMIIFIFFINSLVIQNIYIESTMY